MGVQRMRYLGILCMCILYLKSRCTETDSEQLICTLPFAQSFFGLVKGGKGQRWGAPPFPHLGETLFLS